MTASGGRPGQSLATLTQRRTWFLIPSFALSWQRQHECASHADRALDRQVAAHAAREVAADGEAESRAFLSACERRVHLHEGLEHALEVVGRDTAAGVGHVDDDRRVAT